MNLHEFQAKLLLVEYGVAVPAHRVVTDAEEAPAALDALGGSDWVVKAQVHAGGRGKAGGVKRVRSREEAITAIRALLGTRLVTYQTGADGQPVNEILIEKPAAVTRELYLGMVVDRAQRKAVLMASTEGGVEIERIAVESPGKILRAAIHPLVGLQPYQCRELAFGLGLTGEQMKQFQAIAMGLARMFRERDLSLLEINPLAVTDAGDLLCLDAKINVDDNGLYRQKKLAEQRDLRQEDAREVRAKQWDLSYIALDGDIGCMVNGAGLAMATMDLVQLNGGRPANFLDVGGTATKERVAEAFKIILDDKSVKGVLVNIFGGIVRCDVIAEGIMAAVKKVGVKVPVVVRLEGTNAKQAREMLSQSGLAVTPAESLTDAAKKVVAAAKSR
jgi:succinyl-CoA synthetase beta subunit